MEDKLEHILKPEDQQGQQEPQPKSLMRLNLLTSSEGCLLLIGVAGSFIYTFWLAIKLLFSPEQAQVLIGVTSTAIIFGRAAGMAFGYSLGLGPGTIIPICMLIETLLVLIFYPLFVLGWRRLLVVKFLRNIFERIQNAAEARKDFIHRYGIVGLFVFVWFPFWMTGPVVGCVIGFMLGLKVWINIPVVLAGTYVAIIGWSILLHQLHNSVASYSSYAAMVLMILLVIIIIAGHLLHQGLHKNKDSDQKTTPSDTEQQGFENSK
jgi:uncharacterized membrane protein